MELKVAIVLAFTYLLQLVFVFFSDDLFVLFTKIDIEVMLGPEVEYSLPQSHKAQPLVCCVLDEEISYVKFVEKLR